MENNHNKFIPIKHKKQSSQDSGTFLDYDEPITTRNDFPKSNVTGEFVTVVAIESKESEEEQEKLQQLQKNNNNFVTVLTVNSIKTDQFKDNNEIRNTNNYQIENNNENFELENDVHRNYITNKNDSPRINNNFNERNKVYENELNRTNNYENIRTLSNYIEQEILVYRLPGERLGFGLKFEGGLQTNEKVDRLFIQSCAKDSPASRTKTLWGHFIPGDEIIEINNIKINELTRLECVKCLKESSVVLKLLIKHTNNERDLIENYSNEHFEHENIQKTNMYTNEKQKTVDNFVQNERKNVKVNRNINKNQSTDEDNFYISHTNKKNIEEHINNNTIHSEITNEHNIDTIKDNKNISLHKGTYHMKDKEGVVRNVSNTPEIEMNRNDKLIDTERNLNRIVKNVYNLNEEINDINNKTTPDNSKTENSPPPIPPRKLLRKSSPKVAPRSLLIFNQEEIDKHIDEDNDSDLNLKFSDQDIDDIIEKINNESEELNNDHDHIERHAESITEINSVGNRNDKNVKVHGNTNANKNDLEENNCVRHTMNAEVTANNIKKNKELIDKQLLRNMETTFDQQTTYGNDIVNRNPIKNNRESIDLQIINDKTKHNFNETIIREQLSNQVVQEAEFYTNLFLDNNNNNDQFESESDDTGSSHTTTIDRLSLYSSDRISLTSNSSFSDIRSIHSYELDGFENDNIINDYDERFENDDDDANIIDFDKVLKPLETEIELNLNHLSKQSFINTNNNLKTKNVQTENFNNNGEFLIANEEISETINKVAKTTHVKKLGVVIGSDVIPTKIIETNSKTITLNETNVLKNEKHQNSPKPLPRLEMKTKFKSGKKMPPPPPTSIIIE